MTFRRGSGYTNSLAFLAVPVLIWAAVRFGQRGAVVGTALVVSTAVVSTSLHVGPHDSAEDGASLLLVWLFAVVCALTALVIGAAIAERDRVVEELEVSRARFRDRYLKTPVMLHSTDAEGRIVAVSDAWAAKMGFSRHEILGRALGDFLDAPSREAFERSVVQATAPPDVRDLPLRFVAQSGEVFETHLSATRDSGLVGRDRHSLAVVVDVTRRIRAEASLARARYTLDHARDLVLWLSADGVVRDANPSATRVFGDVGPDGRPRGVEELFADLSRERWHMLERQACEGVQVSVELTARRPDGTSFPVEVDVSTFDLHGEEQTCLFARDLSARQELEDQLRQSQKLLAIGTLAGGVAHDFNNILAIILGNVSLAQRLAPDDEDLRECLSDVAMATQRGARLVRQIMLFARKKEVTREPIVLGQVVAEVDGLLRAVLPSTVVLSVCVDAPALAVLADATELHQVLMNLCTNAAQAMERGSGVLAVQVALTELDEEGVRPYPALRPGPHARVTVADTGEGIAPEAMVRIFEPFFTTKPVGMGTGMGLAVVHGIVTALGGAIAVRSQVGLGTAFDLLLPALPATAPAANQVPAPVVGGSERIFVVDDEPELVKVLGRDLHDLGYTVSLFTSSAAAIRSFEVDPYACDLVITDLTMPEHSGEELVRRVWALRPTLPVLLCTGNVERMDLDTLDGPLEVLRKPVRVEVLAASLRRHLSTRGAWRDEWDRSASGAREACTAIVHGRHDEARHL